MTVNISSRGMESLLVGIFVCPLLTEAVALHAAWTSDAVALRAAWTSEEVPDHDSNETVISCLLKNFEWNSRKIRQKIFIRGGVDFHRAKYLPTKAILWTKRGPFAI